MGPASLFIADQYNARIRKVSSAGIITTLAGNGSAGYAGDGGPATSAEIARPAHVALDGSSNVFILDTVNDVVRRVSPSGDITTVAGNGSSGYSGDGGAAVNAQMNNPTGLAVDAAGNLLIADTYNCAVRKVSVTGTITTFAGGTVQSVSDFQRRVRSSRLVWLSIEMETSSSRMPGTSAGCLQPVPS